MSYKILAKHNGVPTIKSLLLEETNELIEAIEENYETDIIQEMADVVNLIKQYVYATGQEQEFNNQFEYKVKRAKERLGI